ncbi:MAG: hypothetical protein ACOCZK_04290 [Planctomycetota bacterium]
MRRTPNRRTPALLLALLLACLAGGCMQVEDRLRIAADGSATVTITVTTTANPQQLVMGRQMYRMHGGEVPPPFPPLTQQEAQQLFPEDGLGLDFSQSHEGDTRTITVTVHYPDLATLVASPYAARHQLRLQRDPDAGVVVVHSVDAMQEALILPGLEEDDEVFARMPVDKALLARRGDFRSTFVLELPGTVDAAAATSVEGQTATWSVGYDDESFQARLRAVRRASCPADAVNAPLPAGPVRLGSQTFSEVDEAVTADVDPVDGDAVGAVAEFIPISLVTTRTFDLSGEGHSHDNGMTLDGVVRLPRELAPERWGKTRIEIARTESGESLIPDRRSHVIHHGGSRSFGMEEEESEYEHHQVQLQLALPPLAARSLQRLEAEIGAFYAQKQQVIKLPQAVAAERIQDGDLFSWSSSNSPTITHPVLSALQGELELQQATRSSGVLMLRFGLSGERAGIAAMQVYDATGQPWPTMMLNRHGNLQALVFGQPQPPLSLAVELKVSGEAVRIPITLDDIPLGGQGAGAAEDAASSTDELPDDALPDDAIPLEEALP